MFKCLWVLTWDTTVRLILIAMGGSSPNKWRLGGEGREILLILTLTGCIILAGDDSRKLCFKFFVKSCTDLNPSLRFADSVRWLTELNYWNCKKIKIWIICLCNEHMHNPLNGLIPLMSSHSVRNGHSPWFQLHHYCYKGKKTPEISHSLKWLIKLHSPVKAAIEGFHCSYKTVRCYYYNIDLLTCSLHCTFIIQYLNKDS